MKREWEVAGRIHCDLTGGEVCLLEEWVWSPEGTVLPGELPFTVEASRCSGDLACNANPHIRCRWAFHSLGFDPFEVT